MFSDLSLWIVGGDVDSGSKQQETSGQSGNSSDNRTEQPPPGEVRTGIWLSVSVRGCHYMNVNV